MNTEQHPVRTGFGALPPPPPPPALRTSPDGVTLLYASLKYCLTWAYGVRPWQISGPDWIDAVRYDIVAKASGPAPVDELKRMMQTLLAERFRMALRHEKRDAPVMALVTGKDGPKFQPAASHERPDSKVIFGPRGIRTSFQNGSIAELEAMLSFPEWDPVVDMTGLTGGFDFSYELPRRDPENGGAWFAEIQASLQKQLGLKLERGRAPLEFLVIERAERKPVEN